MKKLLVLSCLIIASQYILLAQSPLIKGRVIDDSTGSPIPNVSVTLSGTNKGATIAQTTVAPPASQAYSWAHLPVIEFPVFKKDTFTITAYGAISDGITLNTTPSTRPSTIAAAGVGESCSYRPAIG